MTTKETLHNPARRPTRPGAPLLEDTLPALAITQARFGELFGVRRSTLSPPLHAHGAFTPDMALRLGKLLGPSAGQSNWVFRRRGCAARGIAGHAAWPERNRPDAQLRFFGPS